MPKRGHHGKREPRKRALTPEQIADRTPDPHIYRDPGRYARPKPSLPQIDWIKRADEALKRIAGTVEKSKRRDRLGTG